IGKVRITPTHAMPDQEIKVEADVRSAAELGDVELRWRVAGPGYERQENTVRMTKDAQGRYTAAIPAQKAGQIGRLRIKAVDAAGGERIHPNENEVRPALSVYVHDKLAPGNLPLGFVINVGQAEFRNGQREDGPGYRSPPSPTPPARGKSAFVYV